MWLHELCQRKTPNTKPQAPPSWQCAKLVVMRRHDGQAKSKELFRQVIAAGKSGFQDRSGRSNRMHITKGGCFLVGIVPRTYAKPPQLRCNSLSFTVVLKYCLRRYVVVGVSDNTLSADGTNLPCQGGFLGDRYSWGFGQHVVRQRNEPLLQERFPKAIALLGQFCVSPFLCTRCFAGMLFSRDKQHSNHICVFNPFF